MAGALAVCEQCCVEVVNLPIHPALSEAEIDLVAAQVLAWVREGGPTGDQR
jgi:dTDP-4-amino-4,6-dideoxygalactose transaminase